MSATREIVHSPPHAPHHAARPAGEADSAALQRLRDRLNASLLGKAELIEFVLAALLARGHVLLEDTPGLGKTTLAKSLAAAIEGRFARVQCTPDLLPGDITGFNIYNQQTRSMEFVPGPVFADVLLADEINRATPRTQSALLEVMAERQVTVDRHTHRISDRFLVIATQNPLELHGTFPLPESLLDRFAMKLRVGYPQHQQVVELLGRSVGQPLGDQAEILPVLTLDELALWQQQVAQTAVAPALCDYLARLGEAIARVVETPAHPRAAKPAWLKGLGISPRGLLIWLRLAQAWARLAGRHFVTPDDLQSVAGPVLEVRLGLEADEFPSFLAEVLDGAALPE